MTVFELISTYAILFILGGILRLIEGSGDTKIPHWILTVSFFVLALGGFVPIVGIDELELFAFSDWFALGWIVLWSGLCLIVGHTQWEDWKWQATRFAMFGAIALFWICEPYVLLPVMFAIAGVLYTPLIKMSVPKFWLFDGGEAYARFIAGGVVLNPAIWLSLNTIFVDSIVELWYSIV